MVVPSRRAKQLGCPVIKRGSETLVSCYEVPTGLVLLSSARCWGGVGWGRGLAGLASLAMPWRWGQVPGPGQAKGQSLAAGMVSLMGQALPAAAEGPTGSDLEFRLLLPCHAFVLSSSGLSWVPRDLESS